MLQGLYEQEHERYATKTDFIVMRNEVRAQIDQLEVVTDHLEQKTDRLEQKTDRLEAKTDLLEEKMTRVEIRITAEISGLKTTIDQCKNEFSSLRTDIATLTSLNRVFANSHKYILWIGGGLAIMCMSVFGLCIPIILHIVK